MSSQDNDQDTRVVAVVLISTILLAVGLALGMGIYKARGGASGGTGGSAAATMAMAALRSRKSEALVATLVSGVIACAILLSNFEKRWADFCKCRGHIYHPLF